MKMNLNLIPGLTAIFLICGANGSANANTMTWNFKSTEYSDFQEHLPPLAYGTLLTEDNADQDGHYKVIEITGFFGSDKILGLANRSSRPWDATYTLPDNSVSISPWDVGNGCVSEYAYWGSLSPHFSCAGLSFKTQNGIVNLAYGGAVPFLIGYQNESIMAHHLITPVTTSVPEPSTLMLAWLGLATLSGTVFAKKRNPD